ncbi:MAG: halocyanin domain-containing protein [Halopenitus sp.]
MSQSTDDGETVSRRTFVRAGAGAAVATSALSLGSGTVAAQYGGWLDGVDGYEGTVDYTGRDEVTVTVGARDGLSFDPVAILVDPGTTVVWEWSGQGGQHNVVHKGGAFESKLAGEEGHTFEHVFESEGTFKYFCNPHKAVGMKGVVAVGSTDDKLIDPQSGDSGGGGDGSGDGSGGDGSGDGSGGDASGDGSDGGADGSDGGSNPKATGGTATLSRDDLIGVVLGLATAIPLLSIGLGVVDLDPE